MIKVISVIEIAKSLTAPLFCKFLKGRQLEVITWVCGNVLNSVRRTIRLDILPIL